MNRSLLLALLSGFGLAAVAHAAPLAEWDFNNGNPFTSAYAFAPLVDQSSYYPEGIYGITTNPQLGHNLWRSFGDHTTGSTNMMIANGDTVVDTVVFKGDATGVAGNFYLGSLWTQNAYTSGPAQIAIHFWDDQLNEFQGPVITVDSFGWAYHSFFFQAPSNNFSIVIRTETTAFTGNDLAMDDIQINQVPEPAALSILGLSAVGLLIRRR